MRARLAIVGLSLLLYVSSCVAPALQFTKSTRVEQIMRGYEVLLLGWQGLFVGNFGWVANFVYFPSLFLCLIGLWRTAATCGALALALALHSLMLAGKTLDADEAGVAKMVLTHWHPGFYLWVSSIAVVVLGSLWCRARSK